jgi:hypothetical protein
VDPNGPSEQAWSIANKLFLRKGTHLLSQAAAEDGDRKLKELMALGRFAISHENSVAEHFRTRLTAHAKKLRETARADPNVTVVTCDPKSDEYKKELSSSAPVSDGNPTGPKRPRGALEELTTGTNPIDPLNLDLAPNPAVEKPVGPLWEIIKAPALFARHLLKVVFHSEELQWSSVKLHRIKPFWMTSAKRHPNFTENVRQHQKGQNIGTCPKALSEHWGGMAFMSTVAQDDNACVATTVEEGIHILEGTRFECHAWQTLFDPRKILSLEDQKEWHEHDAKHPPKINTRRARDNQS